MELKSLLLYLLFYMTEIVKQSYGCPKLCTCINKEVHCNQGKINKIAMDIPSDIVLLNLENNHVSRIHKTVLSHLSALKVLRLANNRINAIDEGAFDDLKSLIKLDLAKNKIQYLQLGIFSKLKSLQLLYLYDNKLQNVEGLFTNLNNLEKLALENNDIKEITNKTFKYLVKLQHLKLSGNDITTIEPGAFQTNLKLTMVALSSNPIQNVDNLFKVNLQVHYLDLENCGLSEFPKGMPWTVKYLKLSKNNITRITKVETQEYAFISVIILEENNLSYIETGTFSHMGFLTDVFLIKNDLDFIPGPFPQSLRSLYLDKNKIKNIPMSSFQHGTSLSVLSLRSNQIQEITPPSFANLQSIRELHLERNPLEKFHDNTFLFVRGLEYMSLNYLHLSMIYQDCFLGLKELEKLELSFLTVPPGKISGNPFLSTPSLKTLTLQESPTLAEYVLKNDQILKSIGNLTSINLMDNNLMTLPPTFQQVLPNLQEIKLAGNEFSCDTNLIWLRKWMVLEPEKFPEPHNVLCFYPQSLYGTAILDVSISDFKEPETPYHEPSTSVTPSGTQTEKTTTQFYDYNYVYYDPDFSNYETYDTTSSEELHDYDDYYHYATSSVPNSGNISFSDEKSLESKNKNGSNFDKMDTNQGKTSARTVGIAVATGFGVVFGMLLIAGIIYCFWQRRHHVVHNEARQCKAANAANDYVFIVSKKESEVPSKPRKLTREERGSTTSKASEDITNSADPTMKVYILND